MTVLHLYQATNFNLYNVRKSPLSALSRRTPPIPGGEEEGLKTVLDEL